MITAFDTDVLTEILLGNPEYADRVGRIPFDEQAVPVVVIEEIIRGRLSVIRQAEAGKTKITIEQAYSLFEETINDLGRVTKLSHTFEAELQYRQWRQQGIRISTHDLRIAAICVTHSTKLISRNRRDFELVPGLTVEFWK